MAVRPHNSAGPHTRNPHVCLGLSFVSRSIFLIYQTESLRVFENDKLESMAQPLSSQDQRNNHRHATREWRYMI
jgi:hypothetical protein